VERLNPEDVAMPTIPVLPRLQGQIR
jgi:hypothetical protein